jgi:hypothetical protein
MKKLTFMFDWIGPGGPMRNGEIPDIVDLARSYDRSVYFDKNPNRPGRPTLYNNFSGHGKSIDIVPSYLISNHAPSSNSFNKKFIYEIVTDECINLERLFNNYLGILSNVGNRSTSNELVYRLKRKQGWLVITHPFESFLSNEILFFIHQYFNNLDIPLSQIVYSTCCPNGDSIYKEFCQTYRYEPELNCEFMPTYFLDLRIHHRHPEFSSNLYPSGYKYPSSYLPGPRTKDFLCFNRRYREQRILFSLLIYKNKLMDRFYLSLDKTRPESGDTFKQYVYSDSKQEFNHCQKMLPKLKIDVGTVEGLNQLLPLRIDTDDFNSIISNQTNDQIIQVYQDSLVHIISETNFFTSIIHMTEKTMKPIVYLQPFIILGSPHSLKYLKEMGFKTFDKFWDESYDEETDHAKRLLKIVNLCQQIAEWDDDYKLKFTYEVKEIVDFNYDHFLNGSIPILDRWEEKYGN